jgi:hypothetical protein
MRQIVNPLERYLNHACKHIYGIQRQTVRQELKANILHHTRDLQISGLNFEDALELALKEFGSSSAVGSGFFYVHTFPILFNSLLSTLVLGLAMATLLFGALSWSRAATVEPQVEPQKAVACKSAPLKTCATKGKPHD